MELFEKQWSYICECLFRKGTQGYHDIFKPQNL